MKPRGMLRLERSHAVVIDAARAALDHARSMAKVAPTQRGLHGLHFTYWTFIELVVMAAIPSAVLVWFRPLLMQFWLATIIWWSRRLDLPLTLTNVNAIESLQWRAGYSGSLLPTAGNGAITASLVIAVYAGTFWMSDRQTPLKYVVRTLCVVQASALLFFMFSPSMFSYTMGGHLTSMLDAGYYLMLAVPLLLALGWGVLRVPTYQKLLYPILMAAYFAVMVPHKALLHALILQHFSVLFMPILYLCFGTVFDLMVFVALYSWLASMAPPHALNQEITP
jgi:hypothetical protein